MAYFFKCYVAYFVESNAQEFLAAGQDYPDWLGCERRFWHGFVSIAVANQLILAVDIDALVFFQHDFDVKRMLLFHDAVARGSITWEKNEDIILRMVKKFHLLILLSTN